MNKIIWFGLAADVLVTVERGLALLVLWGWFVVPAFGLPSISFPVATGLSLILSLFTDHLSPSNSKLQEVIMSQLYDIIVPIGAIGIGALVRLFM